MSLEPHPLSEMFPPMPEMELAALAEDICEHGLHDPIVLYEGKILDGRHRYQACRSTGVPIRTRNYEGADPVGFVWSANFHRRQLDREGRRAAIAAYDKLNPGLSANEVAKRLNISHHTVISVRDEVDPDWRSPLIGNTANNEPELSPNLEIPNASPARREASGRNARGRKPAAIPRPPAKPNDPALQRDRGVVMFADMLRRDFERGLDDMTRVIADQGERIEQIGEDKRRELVSRYAAALGMPAPYAELSAAEETVTQMRARIAELEAQLHPAMSPEPTDRKPGRAKYPFETLVIGETVFIETDKPQNVASAASLFASRRGWTLKTKRIEGGTEVTRTL